MNRSRTVFFLLSLLLVFPILAGTLLRAADKGQPPADDSLYKYLAVFSEVLGLVRQAHVDAPDAQVLMAGALDGTTDALDPFSLYVPANQIEGYLRARGIGQRHSGLILLKEHGVPFVVAVEKGSPADGVGIRAGDIVAKIDDRSTRLMPLWEVQELLAAKPGTAVTMELLRLGEPVQAKFELKEFEAPPVSLTDYQGAPLLRIPSFDADTVAAVRRELQRLGRDKTGLLVDLRGVSSGDAETAYATAELFASGDLGALKRRQEDLQTFAGKEAPVWQGRLVLLVDRGTLGASEVFATVLRQKRKAELVGERTFGHAGRQAEAKLSTGGRLLYTEAFYTGPDRQPLRESLKPDVLVSERVRTFLEKDLPIGELILRRGANRLLGREQEPEKKAA
jgi:carboxyl-terminal processing protease